MTDEAMTISKKAAERLLAINNIGVEEAFEKAPDGVIVCNRDGSVCYANSRVTTILGWSTQQLIGEHISVLIPEETREKHDHYFEHWCRHPKARSMGGAGAKVFGLHIDGGEIPLYIELTFINTKIGALPVAYLRYRGDGKHPAIDDAMDRVWVLKEESPSE